MKWWVKSAVQAALSQMPYGEALNHRLQIWNGFYERFHWSVENNVRHLCNLASSIQKFGGRIEGCIAIEVGTGWTPTLPVGMHLLGAEIHTYDHMRHLRPANLAKVIELYPEFLPQIEEALGIKQAILQERLASLRKAGQESVPDWLREVGIHYHAPGDAADTGLPEESVDLYFSIAVLEHVSKASAERMILEARRILKPGGLSYHHIGLHDHLAETDSAATKINFLRFNDFTWKILGQNRIQYHNRLRQSEFLSMFQEAGFEILSRESEVDEASLKALPTMALNKRYLTFDAEDLATYEFTVCVRKPDRSRLEQFPVRRPEISRKVRENNIG
jgi:hypothetical protein